LKCGFYLVLSLLVVCQVAHAEESLCTGNETIVFSCHVGRKVISLCRPSGSPRKLTYRYGVPGRLELIYPGGGPQATGTFYTSSSPLFGGGVTTLAFTHADYEYRIYSKVSRADNGERQQNRTPVFEDGLVIFRNGKQVRQLVCADGGEGFREDIDWLPSRSNN
jgi:hypothetical protein